MNLSNIGAHWLVDPVRAQALLDQKLAHFSARGDMPSAMPDDAFGNPVGSGAAERPYLLLNGIAVIGVSGLMTKDYSWFGDVFTKRLRVTVHRAVQDAEAKGILFVVTSPGGEAAGCQELFDDVRIAAKSKPTDVFFEDLGASAGYYGFCGARRLTVNMTGWVGCLGTVSSITDYSALYEANGLKKYVFSTGPLKGSGMVGAKITEDQLAEYQRIVDQFGEWFLQAVMKGRKMSRLKAKALFTGGIFNPSEALKNGLIDAIGTLDGAVSDLLAYADSCPDGMYPMTDPDEDPEDEPDCRASGGPVPTTITHTITTAGPELFIPRPQTISAAQGGGSTGPGQGAGKTTSPSSGTGAKLSMKNTLIRALAAFKLGRMATAVTMSNSEEPEALASAMAEQVEAEVTERVTNHPLMVACAARGVTNPDQFAKVLEMADLGAEHLKDIRAEAQAEAVRAYGDQGGVVGAQVENLPAASVKTMLKAWRAEADAKYGIGVNGSAAERKTAPSGTVAATDVDDAKPKTKWEQLSEAQRNSPVGKSFKTAEAREAFAANLLGQTEEN